MAADRAVSLRIINSTRRKRLMDELLSSVLNAYGGLDNWSQVTTLTVKLELGGPFWAARGWPGVYAGETVILDARRERIAFTPFTAPDRTSVLGGRSRASGDPARRRRGRRRAPRTPPVVSDEVRLRDDSVGRDPGGL